MSAASRELHSDNPHPAIAVEVSSFERHWITRAYYEKQTYVGAIVSPSAMMNALCVPMNFNPKFQQRERDNPKYPRFAPVSASEKQKIDDVMILHKIGN